MKFKIEGFTIEAKRPMDQTPEGKDDLPVYLPEYPIVNLPDDAIAISIKEEIMVAIPKNTPRPPAGMEQLIMPQLLKKHTHGICRITYLRPIKI